MTAIAVTYVTFAIVVVLAVIFDLGLFSRKGRPISMGAALRQTAFWVLLAMLFFAFTWYQHGKSHALEYLSAYLMEWSLSIDNIFVFILIFTFFGVGPQYYGRVLLIGILLAIVLRILFISVGIVLVAKFNWLLYIFGAILVYTGTTMFFAKADEEQDLEKNMVYTWLKKILPLTDAESGGRYSLYVDGKRFYTRILVVVILLASTDIVFALDSIPAVFGITQDKMVIYTSNIFAVLGLRSLFFLLKSAVNSFTFLPQGIAVVLVFIGVKMLLSFFNIHITISISLMVILVCISASILLSLLVQRRKAEGQAGK